MDGLGLGRLGPRVHNQTMEADAGLASGGAINQELVDATFQFIDELQWSAAKSIRTSIITLASFNVVAGFATLACILWDCWTVARRNNNSPQGLRTLKPSFITTAHTYPFILSLGIVVQGIIFAVIQSRGLNGLLLLGCIPLSQAMMPATFIVPYIQMVFSLESVGRALRRNPFPTPPRWLAPGCVIIVVLGLVGTYLATVVNRPPDACFADLFWFTQAWRVLSFGLFVAITGALLLCGIIIFVRLRQSMGMPSFNQERQAASNMVYYIVMAMISNGLMIPFFVNVTFGDVEASATQALEVAMIASVVANLSGIMTGGLYLFLRSSTRSAAENFGQQDFDQKSQGWESPVFDKPRSGQQSIPPAPYSPSVYPAQGAEAHGAQAEQRRTFNGLLRSLRDSSGFFLSAQAPRESVMDVPPVPQLPSVGVARSSHTTSLNQEPALGYPAEFLLPAATYNPNQQAMLQVPDPMDVLMPPPLCLPGAGGHKRDSSMSSSGTVQIGMRLSNMDNARAMTSPRGLHGSSYLRSPVMAPSIPPSRSVSPVSALDVPAPSEVSPVDPRHKELPEIPLQASPKAYNAPSPVPRIRLASPKGVGFNQDVKATSPSRLRGQTLQDPSTPVQNAEWI